MRFKKIAALAACLLATAGAASASPVAGRWRTLENEGVVDVYDCDGGVCGRVVTSRRILADPGLKDAYNKDRSLRSRPIKGLAIFQDMRGGPTVWKGRVYNPGDGGTYSGTLTLVDANTLKLRGCIVFPLCKTQVWTRMHEGAAGR
ncbi:MAG: DUF2147 domain-containing protein [Caulobacteraceae bacterium]|nr:DUF2147 domain-containing protein [Caulobacter sp.]